MIQPDDIRRKAENLYGDVLDAWLDKRAFFPRDVPSNRSLDSKDHAGANQAIQKLREHSKESRGFGYSVDWKLRKSRDFGLNSFPVRIYFETLDDYLQFVGKQSEFKRFADAVERLLQNFPQLENWVRLNRRSLVESESKLDGLIEVLFHFQKNPRPNRFARELSLSVDTKFIHQHEGILTSLLDLVMPSETVHSHETQFARRFGLLYPEMHVVIRFLDPELQRELSSAWPELSLPLNAIAKLTVKSAEIIIVENKVNLLTLPPRPRTLAFGGLGRAVTELRVARWLVELPITYWGDLDVEGFEILSAIRTEFPQVKSLLMDSETLARYRSMAVPGTARQPTQSLRLNVDEMVAFERCRLENIRVEQERIPFVELLK